MNEASSAFSPKLKKVRRCWRLGPYYLRANRVREINLDWIEVYCTSRSLLLCVSHTQPRDFAHDSWETAVGRPRFFPLFFSLSKIKDQRASHHGILNKSSSWSSISPQRQHHVDEDDDDTTNHHHFIIIIGVCKEEYGITNSIGTKNGETIPHVDADDAINDGIGKKCYSNTSRICYIPYITKVS